MKLKLLYSLTFILIFVSQNFVFAQPGSQTAITCPTGSVTTTLPNSGFSGDNPTTAAGSCGQCCYAGSDLDGDGDQDVSFSVENSKWFKFCNTTGSTITKSFTIDETANDCNLQGAIFVGTSASPNNASDALDVDCSNSQFSEYGSNVSGNADGFSFTNIDIPNGQCAYIMVDGYGGATCLNGFTISTSCVTCTAPTSITESADITICEGTSTALTATAVGGTIAATPGTVYYRWTPTTALTPSNGISQGVTAAPTGTTTYTVTACNDGVGTTCCVTDLVVVTVTPTFTANAGPDVTSCAPSTVTIGGSPTGPAGSTYSWVETGANAGIAISGSATVANPTVAISAGATGSATYTVTVTNGACVRTDAVTVTVGTLAINAGVDQDLCAGSTLVIGGAPTGPAGTTYSWAETGANANVSITSSTTIANPTVTATSAATGTVTYTVTGTLSGCSNTDAITITIRAVPTTPTATASVSPICAGTSSTLTAAGGAGAGTYSWWTASSGGALLGSANTLVVTPLVTTTYYIQSTDATYGCISARGSVTVTVNPTPVANAGVDVERCAGTAIALSGTITNPGACAPVQTWSVISGSGTFSNANSLTSNFTATSTGTITLRLTPCAPGGCVPVTDDVILTINPAPTVSASTVSDTICPGLATDLSALGLGGTPAPDIVVPNNFSSDAGPFAIPDNNVNGVVIPISVSGIPNATLGITDISGVNVNVDHNRIGQVEVWLCPPGVATTSPYAGCIQLFDNYGGNGDDLVNTEFSDVGATDISTGTAPFTDAFNLPGASVFTSLDGSPTNGTWNLVVLDNSGGGATTGTAGQWGINFASTTPAPNPYTYSWANGTGLSATNVSDVTLFSSSFVAPTTITKIVTVTDSKGCTISAPVVVQLLAPPTATLNGSTVDLCPAGAIGQDNVDVTIDMTGISAWTFTPVKDGVNDVPITSSSDPYLLNLTYAEVAALGDKTLVLTVTNVSDKYCNGTSSGNMTITAMCVLPVNLISFLGYNLGRDNFLSWETASEENNDFYTLEKSIDGVNFNFLDNVDSKMNGNSSVLTEYDFVDNGITEEVVYYRLKQTDFNGVETILGIEVVSTLNTIKYKLIPNPVLDYANLILYENDLFTIVIRDVTGKTVFHTEKEITQENQNILLNFSEFNNGTYFIELKNSNSVKNIKVNKTSK